MKTYLLTLSLCITMITSCTHFPYRIDVDQGNIIDDKKLSQLSIGMSKSEVQRMLGTSLLTDVFHRDRWDYLQYYKQGNTQSKQKSLVSLFFVNDLLKEIKKDQRKPIKVKSLSYGNHEK